ncbi:hypothetical protein PSPO01_07351 [Paraphaeosphaeria sporulosa]
MSSAAKQSWIVSEKTYTVTLWTLCAIALIFLASRFALRASTKGELMGNDYFLVAGVPILLTGFALLQSVIYQLYWTEESLTDNTTAWSRHTDTSRRLVAAIELIWVAIYCVKFCYLAQFKFYKPPYAVGFLFTLVQPIVLCTTRGKCRYIDGLDTRSWEIAVTVIDIVTDVLVMSIPMLLVHMANHVRPYTIANFVFKSLSIFSVVVAATRLALQYDSTVGRIRYVSVTFLLVIEATIALIMVSISGYRVVFLDFLSEWERRKTTHSTRLTVRQGRHRTATAAGGGGGEADNAKPSQPRAGSLLSKTWPSHKPRHRISRKSHRPSRTGADRSMGLLQIDLCTPSYPAGVANERKVRLPSSLRKLVQYAMCGWLLVGRRKIVRNQLRQLVPNLPRAPVLHSASNIKP